MLSGERFADTRLSILLNIVLRQSMPDRRLADADGLANILNALALLLDPAHYFQFQAGIEYFKLVVMSNSSGGVFSIYRGVRAN